MNAVLDSELLVACVAAAVLLTLFALTHAGIRRHAAAHFQSERAREFGRFVFLVAAAGMTLFGGSKHLGSISYPYTDPEVKYLIDAGSYVTNNAVHVAFQRLIAPASAPLLIDRRQVGSTNDTDWVSFTNTTFAAFANPCDIPFPAATNFDWIVYTTWTPGPTVQTNGVWHAYWGLDKKESLYLIPVRTCVREGANVIATPKSVWDSTNTTVEVEQ